jgi:tRNA threonylcarbamoyl adenosine modification protein (Sua5/YciO/YrdC/YwlC family)
MGTETLRIDADTGYQGAIDRAVAVLRAGGLVAFPTETVYGVGANAALPEAVRRLREVKERTDSKPFTVHVGRPGDLQKYVPSPSAAGRRLASKGWPGPLTLIFSVPDPASAPVMQFLPAGQERVLYHEGTIGLRCPDDQAACDMLAAVEGPVVAASANPAGAAPAVTGREALAYLDGKVDLVLDGGKAQYAKPSTIVRVNERGYEIVREGVLDGRLIARLATMNFLFVCSGNTCRSPIAEGLCRKVLAERLGCPMDELVHRGYRVSSAGTHGMSNSPATPEAVNACAAHGVDISRHRAQVLTPELVNTADYIFGMTAHHVGTIREALPSARAKVLTLDPAGDVEDPLGGDIDLYMGLADHVERLIRHRLEGIEL